MALVENFDADNRNLSEAFDYILDQTEYGKTFTGDKQVNLQKIREDIIQYERSISGEKEGGAKLSTDLYRYLEQVFEKERGAVDEDLNEDVVRLMTMHAGKGREFPVVFSTGLYEGGVPLGPPESSSDLTRERQTLFVTTSRAEEQLYLTRPGRRSVPSEVSYGAWEEQETEESRFLKDLVAGEDYELIDRGYQAIREGGPRSKTVRAIRAQSIRDLNQDNRRLGIFQKEREATFQDIQAPDHEAGKYFESLDVKEKVTFLERSLKAGIDPEMLGLALGLNTDRIKLGFANALNRYAEAITKYTEDLVKKSNKDKDEAEKLLYESLAEIKREHMDDPDKHVAPPWIRSN